MSLIVYKELFLLKVKSSLFKHISLFFTVLDTCNLFFVVVFKGIQRQIPLKWLIITEVVTVSNLHLALRSRLMYYTVNWHTQSIQKAQKASNAHLKGSVNTENIRDSSLSGHWDSDMITNETWRIVTFTKLFSVIRHNVLIWKGNLMLFSCTK